MSNEADMEPVEDEESEDSWDSETDPLILSKAALSVTVAGLVLFAVAMLVNFLA